MREFLAERLAKYRGMSATTEVILVTSGSGQALDLINDILLESGDTVIMEEFTYQGAMNRLRARGVNVLGAKLDDGGIDLGFGSATRRAVRQRRSAEILVHDSDSAESDIIGLKCRKTRHAFEDYTRSRHSGDRRRVLCRFALGRRLAGHNAGDGRF